MKLINSNSKDRVIRVIYKGQTEQEINIETNNVPCAERTCLHTSYLPGR